ncbi:hypothetical protein KY290_024646 [Solanum tuberosum]|uniref:Uncharacterized protein n=1 Tax=Solanum tuberosum TaxID=4113 RepID=A0ABQ7URE2_SOLTU|nr:hypothetical protein KY290_024646 [Solanum tuberosum]
MEVVVLDRFNGNADPEDWISKAERYFNFMGFSEEHWLPLPSLYHDGEALEWFRWMFRNKQFFDWTHFKEKLSLRFPKRTYAKSPVVDAQLSNILALLQKIENKYSVTSKQVLVEDVEISAAIVLSREISLAEENSSCVDNVESHLELFGTSIVEHSSHVDNMFDEMSTGVFTKEIQETSSASSFVADLDDNQSPRVFDECFPSCCPMIVAEVQPDTLNDMLDEESPGPKHNEAQLFDDCSPKDMSKRYVTTTFLDRGSKKSKIEFETFDNIYLAEFENSIAHSNRPLDELMLVVEHGKFTCEFSTHNILCQFSFNCGDIVIVLGTATNHSVWDPGISFKSKVVSGYTVNPKPLLLLGSIGIFGFITYDNSMTLVWDLGQQRCMHASVLLFVIPLAVITSLNFRFQNIFATWAIVDKMVMLDSTGYDTYSFLKGASIVDAYVVHKSMLEKSKSNSILSSWGKFTTTTRLMCYLAHFGGHRLVEELTVAQQIQLAELRKTSGAVMGLPLLESSQTFLAIILQQNHHYLSLLCETPMEVNKKCRLRDPESFSSLQQSYCYEIIACITFAHDSVNIKEVLKIAWLGKREQMELFRVVAFVMILGNMEFFEGNEFVSSILQVDSAWFILRTTIAALYTHLSLGRFNNIFSVWLYSNLEDKVLIEDESIVMNQVQPNRNTKITQLVVGLARPIGPRTSNWARLCLGFGFINTTWDSKLGICKLLRKYPSPLIPFL